MTHEELENAIRRDGRALKEIAADINSMTGMSMTGNALSQMKSGAKKVSNVVRVYFRMMERRHNEAPCEITREQVVAYVERNLK